MKLIDLLVQELPKRGGWPDGAIYICAEEDGVPRIVGSGWHDNTSLSSFIVNDDKSIVDSNQYESALASSQKPAWNGEGLPPVGEKVEFLINPKFGYRNAWIPADGTEMEVVAHKTTTDGNDVAVCYWDEGGAGRSCCLVPKSLKPLRTEAERKRDAAVEAMQREADEGDNWIYSEYEIIYDAIAAGKIPGVKLDD